MLRPRLFIRSFNMAHKKNEPLKTLLTIVVGCLVIFVISHAQWLLYASLLIGVAGLMSPELASGIDFVWMKLAHVLSFIMPTVLLSLIFFLVLFPLSLLSKLLKKKDPLLLSNSVKSTFVTEHKTFTAQSFERPW